MTEKQAILAEIKALRQQVNTNEVRRDINRCIRRLEKLEDPYAGTVPESGSEHAGRKGRSVKIVPF